MKPSPFFLLTWLCLGIFPCISHAARNDSLPALMDRLLSGDSEAIPELVNNRDQALALLKQRLSPRAKDLAPLLEQLGAENYDERIQAVSQLQQLGRGTREAVEAFAKAHRDDPEIVKRSKEVLATFSTITFEEKGTAVVKFLVDCAPVDPALVLSFKDVYQLVFDDKSPEIFQEKVPSETFTTFALQFLLIPNTEETFLPWLLADKNRDRCLETVRALLNENFEHYYPVVTSKSRHSYHIRKLLEEEFSHRIGREQKLLRIKELYDASPEENRMAFDPEMPLRPEVAYHIMNRKGMQNLEPSEYDLLFEILAPMPQADLLTLLNASAVKGMFMIELVRRREDLHPELALYIQENIKEVDDTWLWDLYLMEWVNHLDPDIPPGELDEEWIRFFREKNGDDLVLYWRAENLKLRPENMLNLLSEYPEATRKNLNESIKAFAYILKEGSPDLQERCLDQLLEMGDSIPLSDYKIEILWCALFAHAERDPPEVLNKKMQVLNKLDASAAQYFLNKQLRPERFSKIDNILYNYYLANRSQLNSEFFSPPLSDGGFQLAFMLSKNVDLPPETRAVLLQTLSQRMQSPELSVKQLNIYVVAGLNLRAVAEPVWVNGLFELFETPEFDPINFPLWKLDTSYVELLPLLEEKIAKNPSNSRALLLMGIMISPDHPLWQPAIQEILHTSESTTDVARLLHALKFVNREPALSELSESRLDELFDVTSKKAYDKTEELLTELTRPENRQLALRKIQPYLSELFEQNYGLFRLGELYYRTPGSYNILGETILEAIRSGGTEVMKKAAGNFTNLDDVPASAVDSLGKILSKQGLSAGLLDSLLWSIAKLGADASELTEQVRNIPATTEKLELRKAFALAGISPDKSERWENLQFLMEQYERERDQYILRAIGLVGGFEKERLDFFNQRIEEAFNPEDQKISSHLREVIYRLTDFPDPETSIRTYQDILHRMASPEAPSGLSMVYISNALLERVMLFHPERLTEFTAGFEKLPPACRTTWQYRLYRERLPQALY